MKQFYLLRLKSIMLIAFVSLALFSSRKANAQATTLLEGDLVFTGFNSLGSAATSTLDTFSFVLLKGINTGTSIGFSDRGFFAGSWMTTGAAEGSVVWTCGSNLPLGTNIIMMGGQMYVFNAATGTTTVNGTVAVTEGTMPATSGLVLGTAGDQIFAFQSSNGSIQGSTLIAGIHFYNCAGSTTAATWDVCTGNASAQRSVLPTGLTNGFSAFYTGAAMSQGRYHCPTVIPTTATAIRNSVMTLSNWDLSSSSTVSSIPMLSGCGFIASAPTVTGPSDATKCNGTAANFIVASTGTHTSVWFVSANGGSSYDTVPSTAPYSGVTSDTLKISAVTSAMNNYKYRCVVNNGSGSTTSSAATLSVTTITTSSTSQTNVSCNGLSNGAASVTPTGGNGSYTYSWSPGGATTAGISGVAANTYVVTITDGNSCTGTKSFTILQPPVISTSITSQTGVTCNGGTNGTATVSGSGGTGTLTYAWSPSGATTAAATGLSGGINICTVKDANNCQATQNVTIAEPPAISHSIASQTAPSCNGGANGTATITASGGTGTLTYSWAPSGATAATATNLSSGINVCTIKDVNNCSVDQNVNIAVTPAITHSLASHTDVSCFGGANGTATVTASGGTGTITYSWSPSGGTAATATGLAAGNYTCTIKDANNCQVIETVTIAQPASALTGIASQTNVSCNGGSNGTATVVAGGGTTPYSYSWSPSGGTAATATGLAAGNYSVTITDAHNCIKIVNDTVTQPAVLTGIASQTNVSCNGGSNGTATVVAGGGTTPYSYSWSPSGGTAATATGLAAGNYSVTITDAHNCIKIVNDTVKQPAVLTGLASQTNVSCNGGSNGTATVVAGGGTTPYSYSWSPSGGTAATATGLAAGNYSVTITDAHNCIKIVNDTITQPAALTGIASQTNVSCNGGSNGTATVVAGGGTTPYSYSWSPSGGTAATATGLAAGNYSVTITDAHNCIKIVNDTITQPAALTGIASQTNVSCNGGSNGTATVVAGGGTTPYSYSWSPSGGTAATATGLAAGNYSVTITDAHNCIKIVNDTVKAPTALLASTSQTNIACFGGATGVATVSPTGGTPAYTYLWSPGGNTTATVTGLSAGSYAVAVTDAHGCIVNKSYNIGQPTSAVQVVAINDTNSCAGANVTLGATASGGTPGYVYSWTPGALTGANPVVHPTTTTSYIVTATDANNCTKKDTVVVSVGGVLAQSNQANSISIDGSDTSSNNVLIGNLNFCYNADCKIIASVKDNPALGAISAFVVVDDSVPTFNGRPYLSRWYKITPTNNGPASVNLYYTQQDFDDYNVYASSHGYPLLPQNPTDLAGIDTLVVSKLSGGDINAGTGTFTLIHPDSVKWNSLLHFWTVSLQVPSFSEFFVHAGNANNTPLIINLTSFEANKVKNTVNLLWTTASEQDNVGFTIERAADGKNFKAIGNVKSIAVNGNSNATLHYSFVDPTPMYGMNYYRLAELNKEGITVYTDVRTVNFDNPSVFNCYPNPTSAQVSVEHTAAKDELLSVRFTDVLGKTVLVTKMPVLKGFNKAQIDMSSLSQGMYNMAIIGDDGVLYNTRITKQ